MFHTSSRSGSHVFAHTHAHTYAHAHTQTCTHTLARTQTHTCTHIHTYTHAHTHTHKPTRPLRAQTQEQVQVLSCGIDWLERSTASIQATVDALARDTEWVQSLPAGGEPALPAAQPVGVSRSSVMAHLSAQRQVLAAHWKNFSGAGEGVKGGIVCVCVCVCLLCVCVCFPYLRVCVCLLCVCVCLCVREPEACHACVQCQIAC